VLANIGREPSVACLPRQATFCTEAAISLWTFPDNRIDTPNAAEWRKPVWRTGGSQKAFSLHLLPETDEQIRTPRGSLLAFMTANREPSNQGP
jgi:hypothetical protein